MSTPPYVPTIPSKFVSLGGNGTGNIAVVAKTPRSSIIYSIGSDGVVYEKWRSIADGWTSQWKNLGGNLVGTPIAISPAEGQVNLFAVGPDKAVYYKYFLGTSDWLPGITTWSKVGGTLQASSDGITAVVNGSRTNLFVRGPDNAVYYRNSSNNDWSGTAWENLGGNIVGGITAVSWGSDRIDIFARQADKSVVHKSWTTATGWSAWESLGGQVTSDVAAVSWGPGRLDVFGIGIDNTISTKWWADGKWNPKTEWENHYGAAYGKLSAVAWGGNRVVVYHQGDGNSVWRQSLRGTTWDEYEWLSGVDQVNVSIGPIVHPVGADKPDVFVRAADKAVWTWAQ